MMPKTHGRRHRLSASAVLAATAVALSGAALSPPASASLPTTPTLTLERTISTRPFAQSGVVSTDHEGSAYVPKDNSLWLADDDGHAVYEVDARTGALKRRIRGYRFAALEQRGGGPPAGVSRTAEIQALAYDARKDVLYAFSGGCCPADIQSTAFRLTRRSGKLRLDSYQPLLPGLQVEGAAWNPGDKKLYIGSHGSIWRYSYVTNHVGGGLGIAGITNIYGMDFTYDGKDLFLARPWTRVTRVDWATRTIVPGWNLDLAPYGVLDVRAVEVVANKLWVSDGSDKRSPGDPLDHAVFVFGLGR